VGNGRGGEEGLGKVCGKWVEPADLPTPHHPQFADLFLRKSKVLGYVVNLGCEVSPTWPARGRTEVYEHQYSSSGGRPG